MIDLYTWSTPERPQGLDHARGMRPGLRGPPVDIGKDQQFAPDFLKISPNNKIPAIVDRDNG